MTSITFRRPVALPLYRRNTWPYVPPDPRADDAFEITQGFADLDAYWADRDRAAGREPRTHGAIDMGNYSCGGVVVASAAGVAVRIVDPSRLAGAPTDALGVRIDHGNGVTSEYWHLNGWTIPATPTQVQAGQQIGIVGSTGLGGACHLHFEIKVNGVRIDPEPLAFGAPLVVKEDGLSVTTSGFAHVINRSTKLTVASNFRADATRQADPLNVYAAGTAFVPTMQVSGEAIGPNSVWFGGWMYLPNKGYAFGFFHSSVLAPLGPVEQPDCAAEVAAATKVANDRIAAINRIIGNAVKEIAAL